MPTLPLQRRRLQWRPISLQAVPYSPSVFAEAELHRPHGMPYDMAVMAEILMGTPPQPMTVLLDSGSSDFWVPSSRCVSCLANRRPENRYFDTDGSRTFEYIKAADGALIFRRIHYGTGQIRSIAARDTVQFAGLVAERQSLLLVDTERMFGEGHAWDGILGIACPKPFPAFAGSGPSLLGSWGTAGVLPVLAFLPSFGGEEAELRVGDAAYQDSIQNQTLTWIRSLSEDNWIIDAHVGLHGFIHRQAIIDTGTSLILMTPADFKMVARRMLAGQRCLMDERAATAHCACADVQHMPDTQLRLGETTFVLRPGDVFEALGRPLGGDFGDEQACEFLVSVTPVHREEWILGDVFLRKVVTIFDFERRAIGFAVSARDPQAQFRRSRDGTLAQVRWSQGAGAMVKTSVPSAAQGQHSRLEGFFSSPTVGATTLCFLMVLLTLCFGLLHIRIRMRWRCRRDGHWQAPRPCDVYSHREHAPLYSRDISGSTSNAVFFQ